MMPEGDDHRKHRMPSTTLSLRRMPSVVLPKHWISSTESEHGVPMAARNDRIPCMVPTFGHTWLPKVPGFLPNMTVNTATKFLSIMAYHKNFDDACQHRPLLLV